MTVTMTRTTVRPNAVQQSMADRSAIENLRQTVAAARAAEPPKPTVDQVALIVTGIAAGTPLSVTASQLGLPAGVDAEVYVLDVVATFGTWVAHSTGASDSTVDVPAGYEPTADHKRDLTKAISAVATVDPTSEAVARFVDRTYAQRPSTLSYLMVAGVWNHVSRGRAASLAAVSDDLVFQTMAVEAFDLLDVAREDGISAIEYLLGARETDYVGIAIAAARAEWLAESNMRTIARACELAPTSDLAAARLSRELAVLRTSVQARMTDFMPPGVRNLTLGHVQRICAAAGLKIRTENRLEETEIRMALKDLGLAGDIDRLVPEALRLADKGLLNEFWEVMAARIDGDATWVTQLAELGAR